MSLHTTGGQYKYKEHQQPHTKVWLPSYWAIHNLLLLLTRRLMYRLYRTLLGLETFTISFSCADPQEVCSSHTHSCLRISAKASEKVGYLLSY